MGSMPAESDDVTSRPADPSSPMMNDAPIDAAWREHRARVLDIAVRMLGSVSEAEDVVQEAFGRLMRRGTDGIDDVAGWLVVVVGRLCLDELRSARRRRQRPTDGDLDALDRIGGQDPADRVTLDEGVQQALHVVLARMSPAERTAFVLHDVFQVPFEEVAAIVGRTPTACRQLASRARRRASESGAGRFAVEPVEQRVVADRFIAACATGDLEGLLALLDPDVTGAADVRGRKGAGRAVGAVAVGRALLHYFGPGTGVDLVSLPAQHPPVIAAIQDGELVATVELSSRDGRVHHLHSIVDAPELRPLATLLHAAMSSRRPGRQTAR